LINLVSDAAEIGIQNLLKTGLKSILFLMAIGSTSPAFSLSDNEYLDVESMVGKSVDIIILRVESGTMSLEVGMGNSYNLCGSVFYSLRGRVSEKICFWDYDNFSEPCFDRKLGATYFVVLERFGENEYNRKAKKGAIFEVAGGLVGGAGDAEILKFSKAKVVGLAEKSYWYAKPVQCAIPRPHVVLIGAIGKDFEQIYSGLLDDLIEGAFDKTIKTTQ